MLPVFTAWGLYLLLSASNCLCRTLSYAVNIFRFIDSGVKTTEATAPAGPPSSARAVGRKAHLLRVLMSCVLPGGCAAPVPLATAGRPPQGCGGDAGPLSSPPLLELSSSLPDELSESEELLPLLLLICSMMSTSALSSGIDDRAGSVCRAFRTQGPGKTQSNHGYLKTSSYLSSP